MDRLAEELWDTIFARLLLVPEVELVDVIPRPRRGSAVALTCKAFHRISTPYIYCTVSLPSQAHSDNLCRTLTENPSLAAHVKAVAVNGAYESFLEVSKYLSKLGVHTVSMRLAALEGAAPGDLFHIPDRRGGHYLGSCIAAMRPKVIIIAGHRNLEQGGRRRGGGFALHSAAELGTFTAQARALGEMWLWTNAETVTLNFNVRLGDLVRMPAPPKVPFTNLWIRVNFTADERQNLGMFMKRPGFGHIHLHIVPATNSSTTFLPEFLDLVKEDADLRQRIHLKSEFGLSNASLFEKRLPYTPIKARTPLALSASTGRRWEL